jgi:hypothetical protein
LLLILTVFDTNFRGLHPFDNEVRPSSNWISRIKDSQHPDYSQYFSASYEQADFRLKEKIIYGEVEFEKDPWSELPDGSVSYLVSRNSLITLQIYQRRTSQIHF